MPLGAGALWRCRSILPWISENTDVSLDTTSFTSLLQRGYTRFEETSGRLPLLPCSTLLSYLHSSGLRSVITARGCLRACISNIILPSNLLERRYGPMESTIDEEILHSRRTIVWCCYKLEEWCSNQPSVSTEHFHASAFPDDHHPDHYKYITEFTSRL